jgi:glutamate-ammonia-ligase adenylyltransferase
MTPEWQKAIKTCADPDRASRVLARLEKSAAAPVLAATRAGQAGIWATLFAASEAASELILAHPHYLGDHLREDQLEFPRQPQGLRREVDGWLIPALEDRDYAGAFRRLREFKQREQLRIAARDLARRGDAVEITSDLSNVADVCLAAALRICRQQLPERLGSPFHQNIDGDWFPTPFSVMGLGKLGGQELNYSSDVDIMFLYEEEGHVFEKPPGRRELPGNRMTSHQFFARLVESFVSELTRSAPEGQLFRVDLRLRPEGDAGPLVRSLGSYESYYAQWGQMWERMMLIKARNVAGDPALAHEFFEAINPFRYPRSLGENATGEIAAMKRRIETEVVKTGELDRNVKLGRGGIREIEFIAQMYQLLHGGRLPFLQGAQTLPTLRNLVRYNLLSPDEAEGLGRAYRFLRDVEHRLQMDQNRQTHTLPEDPAALNRIARLMGCEGRSSFERKRKEHTAFVRRIYDGLFGSKEKAGGGNLPGDFAQDRGRWIELLRAHGFRDPEDAVRLLQGFVHGPGFIHISAHTERIARMLIPPFLELCPARVRLARNGKPGVNVLSDPDRVLTRIDRFVAAYGTRAGLFETWTRNPKLFELLLLLFDRSEFLAETAIQHPDLVDDLVLSGWLRRKKDTTILLEELRLGAGDADQHRWLRRYHRSERMRVGLREILGLMDHDETMDVLTSLGEACLQYALEAVTRRHKLEAPPLAIMGLGKLGGREINYGSDLDVLFLARKGARNLSRLQKFAADFLDLLNTRTEDGTVATVDVRLRPDGDAGLLVNSLDACETYYGQRAQLWEIQALTRIRFVAGDQELGKTFCGRAAELTDFRPGGTGDPPPTRERRDSRLVPVAFTPNWKGEIIRMRSRIEKERTPAGRDALAIKTGSGGLIDAEFLAQMICLEHGWQEPNTLRALERARGERLLPKADAGALIKSFRELQRVEGILRRWSYEGETVLPDQDAPYQRVAIRCGFPDSESFRKHIAKCRAAIRKAWTRATSPG